MPTNQQIIAYHEAGHAVVARRLGVKVCRLTIVPSPNYTGACTLGSEFSGRYSDQDKLARAIRINLAGPLAEKKFYHLCRAGAWSDYRKAIGLSHYLTQWLVDLYWKDYQERCSGIIGAPRTYRQSSHAHHQDPPQVGAGRPRR